MVSLFHKPPAENPVYQRYCSAISGPHSAFDIRSVTIPFDEMDILSNAVYNQIVNILYTQNRPKGLITRDQFRGVIRAIFKSRIDHVSSKFFGNRPASCLPLESSILVPRILADAINVYGSFFANDGATQFYPTTDVNASEAPSFNQEDVRKFTSFIAVAKQQGSIPTSYISSKMEGTGAWMLYTSSQPGTRFAPGPHAKENSMHVSIFAQFREFTPTDALMAALIANQRDCVTFIGCTEYPFSATGILCVPMFRCRLTYELS